MPDVISGFPADPRFPALPAILPQKQVLGQVASLFSEGSEQAPAPTPSQRRQMREHLFTETLASKSRRLARYLGPKLRPSGLRKLLAMLDFAIREKLVARAGLPDPNHCHHQISELAGLADDLSTQTIMEGYARGLTLGGGFGPATWWSPAQRLVAQPREIPEAPQGDFRFALDHSFERIVSDCGRSGSTMSPKVMMAFCNLFDAGLAHSWEVCDKNGKILAAGFGLVLGRVFVTENQFFHDRAAAMFGLDQLARHLDHWGFNLIDGKVFEDREGNALLPEAGLGSMAREDYARHLIENIGGGLARMHWRAERNLPSARCPSRMARMSFAA